MLYYIYRKFVLLNLNNNNSIIMNDNTNKYFNSLDENFDIALKLVNQNLSHAELFKMLETGNIPEKQIAALKITCLNSKEEAQILLENLTGQDGKIREAVSLKINELMSNPNAAVLFDNENACGIFLEAVVDINGNICRNVINAVSKLKVSSAFCEYFISGLFKKIDVLLNVIKDFDLRDGKYKVNKEVFKLYWYLEALYEFAAFADLDKLKHVLLNTANIRDYTIREKTAKILTLDFNNPELTQLRKVLKNDCNYYVRRY